MDLRYTLTTLEEEIHITKRAVKCIFLTIVNNKLITGDVSCGNSLKGQFTRITTETQLPLVIFCHADTFSIISTDLTEISAATPINEREQDFICCAQRIQNDTIKNSTV